MENPPCVATPEGPAPAPFMGENWALCRHGMEIWVDGVGPDKNSKWSCKGKIFLSNVRLVFVADTPSASLGLHAFDLPLAYVRREKFNQPIFSCNNLQGEVFPAAENGGPWGALPPHRWWLYFKEGGVGTFLPLWFSLLEAARVEFAPPPPPEPEPTYAQMPAPSAPPMRAPGGVSEPPAPRVEQMVQTAFIDPADPSRVYIPGRSEQPTSQSQATKRKPFYPGKED